MDFMTQMKAEMERKRKKIATVEVEVCKNSFERNTSI